MNTIPFINVLMYFIILHLLNGTESQPLDSNSKVVETTENRTAVKVSKMKIVGSKGSISPHIPQPGMTFEWTIDVTKGNMIELEFETFRLPFEPDHMCDSYIEIYEREDDPIKRVFCSGDRVNKILLDTHLINLKYHSGTHQKKNDHSEYGFKINYTAIPIPKTTAFGSKVAEILLFAFAAVLIFAFCILLFRCLGLLYGWKRTSAVSSRVDEIPSQLEVQNQRQFNNETFAIPGRTNPEPQHELQNMSEASSFRASLSRWASYEHLPAAPNVDRKRPKTDIPPHRSYTMTPNLPLKAKLGEFSNVRTKLVARFSTSSANTSDISVFLPAFSRSSDSRLYSRISDESQDEEVPIKKCQPNSKEKPNKVPSIVITYAE